MHRLQVSLEVVMPGDLVNYSSKVPDPGTSSGTLWVAKEVGAHLAVHADGNLLIEGRVAPDSIDSIVDAIEAMSGSMEHVHWANDAPPSGNWEGWGQRWLSVVMREMQAKVRAELESSLEKLTTAHEQLRRFK